MYDASVVLVASTFVLDALDDNVIETVPTLFVGDIEALTVIDFDLIVDGVGTNDVVGRAVREFEGEPDVEEHDETDALTDALALKTGDADGDGDGKTLPLSDGDGELLLVPLAEVLSEPLLEYV